MLNLFLIFFCAGLSIPKQFTEMEAKTSALSKTQEADKEE